MSCNECCELSRDTSIIPYTDSIYDLKEKLPYDELFRYCLMLEAEDKAKDHALCK